MSRGVPGGLLQEWSHHLPVNGCQLGQPTPDSLQPRGAEECEAELASCDGRQVLGVVGLVLVQQPRPGQGGVQPPVLQAPRLAQVLDKLDNFLVIKKFTLTWNKRDQYCINSLQPEMPAGGGARVRQSGGDEQDRRGDHQAVP